MADRAGVAGQRALVTGASSGLGLHFARVLAAQGAEVVLAARRVGACTEAAEAIRAAGGQARAVALDVTDEASVAAALAEAGPCRIIINNAGIAGGGRALDTPAEDWARVIDTDLSGVFRVAQAGARALVAAGQGGAIVNIASILGLRVAGGVAAYAAAKAGVVQLTRALALEWARHGIRVNALCPGYIETDINRDFFATEAGQAMVRRIPQRRLGQPADLDGALLLLVSEAGLYITGAEIVVDGGHLVSSL
jgi:NAD(P)-dependent dehydrogenase (short-subunit alcohol dehydrogenase family)